MQCIRDFYQHSDILQVKYIRVCAIKAFNSVGKIIGQEILEKKCTSDDTQYVAPSGAVSPRKINGTESAKAVSYSAKI